MFMRTIIVRGNPIQLINSFGSSLMLPWHLHAFWFTNSLRIIAGQCVQLSGTHSDFDPVEFTNSSRIVCALRTNSSRIVWALSRHVCAMFTHCSRYYLFEVKGLFSNDCKWIRMQLRMRRLCNQSCENCGKCAGSMTKLCVKYARSIRELGVNMSWTCREVRATHSMDTHWPALARLVCA